MILRLIPLIQGQSFPGTSQFLGTHIRLSLHLIHGDSLPTKRLVLEQILILRLLYLLHCESLSTESLFLETFVLLVFLFFKANLFPGKVAS